MTSMFCNTYEVFKCIFCSGYWKFSWWHEFGSETVVTPWTMTCNMVANPPKSDVGQMTRTMWHIVRWYTIFFTSEFNCQIITSVSYNTNQLFTYLLSFML